MTDRELELDLLVHEFEVENRELKAHAKALERRIRDIYKQLDATEKEVDDLRLLLRQCWDALDELMHSNSTKAAQHKYLAVTDALRDRLGA